MSQKVPAKEEGYRIDVVGRHVLVTDAMKQYAIDKVSKIERFSSHILDVVIRMDIQKLEHRVDIIIMVDHVKITSSASTGDMYASVDKAVDKLQAQLMKYRKKLRDHTAKKLAAVDMNVNVLQARDEIEEINQEIDALNAQEAYDAYTTHTIVSKKKRPLKTLTQDEAIMKMELSNDAFMIYRSEEDQKLKVIYRRPDGNFGVIEVES